MFQTLVKAFKMKDVRRKIFITLALLLVYRIGCYIPIPGIGKELISSAELGNFTYLQIMSAMTGSSLQYGTLFAMGIGPYINASIIIQLLTVGIPALERLSKQGEEGRKKISNYTRYLTIVLAVAQAIGILVGFSSNINFTRLFGANTGFQKFLGYAFLVIIYTAGACLTMWLGERITDYGVSNGISMLIFVGIIATAGQYIIGMLQGTNDTTLWVIIAFCVVAVLIFAAIVTVDSAERKVQVQYAKQVKGRKMYGGQSTHIPMKVNSSGVMPLIFAYAILSFPDLIINLFGVNSNNWYSQNMGTGSWLYSVVLCVLILFFAYFYNQIQFKPDDISRSIQQNGGFIPGIRPGKPTTEYLTRVSNRITLFGAIFLALVALIPTLIFKAIDSGLVNVFSATGLLIIVSVALEFNQALESQIMMKNYKGFLK